MQVTEVAAPLQPNIMALVTANILQRARESGRCPPSLLTEDRIFNNDGFDAAVEKVLDVSGLALASDPSVAESFKSLLQFAAGVETIPGDADLARKTAILEHRRCLILAIVGATPETNPALPRILSDGYLAVVKTWLDDILKGSVGGIDLLLHMLTNLANLPVTKAVVLSSGMGKAVGSIEKYKIGEGTPNEAAVKERVQVIKDAWNASVKLRKDKLESDAIKRKMLDLPLDASPPAKKAKAEENKKKSSFSSLLKKVAVPSDGSEGNSARIPLTGLGSSTGNRTGSPSDTAANKLLTDNLPSSETAPNAPKKTAKRVKWADHFGGSLTASQILAPDGLDDVAQAKETNVSWSDRRKRDRLREKELLAKAKRAKLTDDDDGDFDVPKSMVITTAWRKPSLLPDRPEVVKPQLESREVSTQYDRISKVPQVRYEAEYDVPTSPAPLSDVEQALDMTSQASAVIATIPFFAPQLPAAAITPIPDATPAYSQPGLLHTTPAANISLQPQFGSAHASAETLQALGLPMFLIGQNVQALQTLASTPSLLSTFVDANGMYDQPRLMNLVQTLSQNIAPGPSQGVGYGAQPYQQAFSAHAPAPSYGTPATAPAPSYGTPATAPAPAYSPPGGIYGPASTSYGQTSSYNNFESGGSGNHGASLKNGYRGNQNDDGNLHLSGYGPTTTSADIITLFSPYVKVDEVVMKGTFTFVNTSDPTGAQRAREALGGALLGGMPIRIKPAQRKARDLSLSGSAPSSIYGPASTTEPRAQPSFAPPKFAPPAAPPSAMAYGAVNDPVPANAAANGYIDVDAVRDDRGNPATKNLFVAGYGPGTTELQLRDIFSSHGPVVGVVLKGSFSFVNTYDRLMAIRSREALNGTLLNGGVLRINFAKETGRLGTSFDLTYGPNTAKTHYGRSYV